MQEVERSDDGTVRFDLKVEDTRPFDTKHIGRPLYKIALEMLALGEGQDYVLDQRFDAARTFVLRGGEFNGNLYTLPNIEPSPQYGMTYLPDIEGTPVAIKIFGIPFVFFLEEGANLMIPDDPPEPVQILPLHG